MSRPRNHPGSHSSPGLYVHVPVCTTKCRYCGFYSEPVSRHDPSRLVAALIRDLDQYTAEAIGTAYIGGGSPTALPHTDLLTLVKAVASRWPGISEFTVECNPGQVNGPLLIALRDAGVGRLSFGAQSFWVHELQWLGRGHTADDIRRSVALAQAVGFGNLGLDLIYAIPGSSLASWQHSLDCAIDLGVQHLSAYGLSIECGTVLEAWVQAGRITPVDEDTDRAMYDWTVDRLAQAGLAQYEISNFAIPGFECRHNQGYWLNRPYLGVGPGAAAYRHGVRSTHVADIHDYVRRIEAGLDAVVEQETVAPADRLCQTALLSLRMRRGIDRRAFVETAGQDALDLFREPIERYRDLGLIEVTDEAVRLTRRALPIADSILCDFADL